MSIVSLLFYLFGGFLNSKLEKKKFYINNKLTIELSPDWDTTSKKIKVDNTIITETIFFSPNSDLNIKVYYFDVFKDNTLKKEADIQDVSIKFEDIMSKIEDKKEYKIPNYKSSKIKSYEYSYYENIKFYVITTGTFMKGHLLKIDIVSTIKEETEKSIYYLFSIKEVVSNN